MALLPGFSWEKIEAAGLNIEPDDEAVGMFRTSWEIPAPPTATDVKCRCGGHNAVVAKKLPEFTEGQ